MTDGVTLVVRSSFSIVFRIVSASVSAHSSFGAGSGYRNHRDPATPRKQSVGLDERRVKPSLNGDN